jgi:hypothetical protein
MLQSILKLSVVCILLTFSAISKADSFFLPIASKVCVIDKENDNIKLEDIILKVQDKASFIAVKNSDYIKNKLKDIDDYDLSVIPYKIADTLLKDIVVNSSQIDNRICLDYKALLDIKKADELLKEVENKKLNNIKIKEIAQEVLQMPKSIYEANDSIPLIYIEDLEYYNQKTTSKYTLDITEQLSFEPRILITENKELADYILIPKLAKSSVDIIDEKNSRYSMSIIIEVTNLDGKKVIKEEKNRYIIIDNAEDMQSLAHKMIVKLLKEALASVKERLNILFKE